ncbi:PhzF family phenazine biosynthesis isomerase [Oceanirhabdus seepicola]|uniref:PhzF family phenazine biosynthesis isomerase n=1 Tax=Oceanirhabdus seepicola TaxID=2828781 RepID=A0A9J6NY09_9CLOT|nr:PhzF family phenazine biosynthesis isomerase [Oceanirhabdus seepicola]MCM1989338.1 PhzF family phenazine biosynthesis isomerase [Oceanirhabdus seepicola]
MMNNKFEDIIYRARIVLKDELNNSITLDKEAGDEGVEGGKRVEKYLWEVNYPWRRTKKFTYMHCMNVERTSMEIVKEGEFNLSEKELTELRVAAILHDVGKFYILENHADKSAELVKKWFEENKDIEYVIDSKKVIKMVGNHSNKKEISDDICESILKDGDVLDESGATSIFMTSKWADENSPFFFHDLSRKLTNRELSFLNKALHRLITPEAKKLMNKKIDFIKGFIEELNYEIKNDNTKEAFFILKGDNSKIYRIGSFTDKVGGGNPAGVVICDREMSEAEMLSVAKEVGYSETAFISKSQVADFKVRFFTPADEVDLCGHATIAAFHVLYENHIIDDGKYTQETKAGVLEVEVESDGKIIMDQALLEFYEVIDSQEICDSLNIPSDFIHETMPIQVVSTGIRDIFVPVKNIQCINSIKPDFNKVSEISKKYNVTGYHVFTLETLEGATAHCRNFAPLYDIPEEAATGTSNGALSCYLYKYASEHLCGFEVKVIDEGRVDNNEFSGDESYGCLDNNKGSVDRQYNMKFEQGYSMDSPSEIYSKLIIRDGKIERIQVGGHAVGIE